MSNYDDNNGEGEEEEEEYNVQDPTLRETISTPGEKSDDQPARQFSKGDDIHLQEKLAKDLHQSLKIAVTHEPPDIGPSPYKVAVVGMNELGSATAFLLISRQVVTDVILIDRNAQRLAGIDRDRILAWHTPSIVR